MDIFETKELTLYGTEKLNPFLDLHEFRKPLRKNACF